MYPPLHNLVLSACLLGSLTAYAEEPVSNTRWVSDSLNTYVRSGPTDGYRIVGTLVSGQKVTLLQTSGDYSQVRGENGSAYGLPTATYKTCPARPNACHSWNSKWRS